MFKFITLISAAVFSINVANAYQAPMSNVPEVAASFKNYKSPKYVSNKPWEVVDDLQERGLYNPIKINVYFGNLDHAAFLKPGQAGYRKQSDNVFNRMRWIGFDPTVREMAINKFKRYVWSELVKCDEDELYIPLKQQCADVANCGNDLTHEPLNRAAAWTAHTVYNDQVFEFRGMGACPGNRVKLFVDDNDRLWRVYGVDF